MFKCLSLRGDRGCNELHPVWCFEFFSEYQIKYDRIVRFFIFRWRRLQSGSPVLRPLIVASNSIISGCIGRNKFWSIRLPFLLFLISKLYKYIVFLINITNWWKRNREIDTIRDIYIYVEIICFKNLFHCDEEEEQNCLIRSYERKR